jgi:hypothetical protein
MMNRKEVLKIMTIVNAGYPTQFKGLTDEVKLDMAGIWATILQDYEYKVVELAVLQFMKTDTKGFIPPVGAILEKTEAILKQKELEARRDNNNRMIENYKNQHQLKLPSGDMDELSLTQMIKRLQETIK